jgi:hypothetical protein
MVDAAVPTQEVTTLLGAVVIITEAVVLMASTTRTIIRKLPNVEADLPIAERVACAAGVACAAEEVATRVTTIEMAAGMSGSVAMSEGMPGEVASAVVAVSGEVQCKARSTITWRKCRKR